MKVFDVVRLLVDVPSEGLHRGDVGTIVSLHCDPAPKAYEVEFTDERGRTVAQLALGAEQVELLGQHGQAGNQEAR
jgi:hypothetical protein